VCQDAFFLDLKVAADYDVEPRLWAAHHIVNSKFKKCLKAIRKEPRKVVERRRIEKDYLMFIKSSLRFYRNFIQRISSSFIGIDELRDVARKLHLNLLSIDTPVHLDTPQKELLLHACHSFLIHCGDLSRYREVELARKTRNWGPAKGYYGCAAQLDPTSGASWNQLSMIALLDGDDFRSLYFNYRSLATANPFPAADDNLIRLLSKIWTKAKQPYAEETKLAAVQLQLMKLHAMIYADVALVDFRRQRDVLLGRGGLYNSIATESCAKSLRRMCLVNIAAHHNAKEVFRTATEDGPCMYDRDARIHNMFLELNISTFTLLMTMTSSELGNIPCTKPQILDDLTSTSIIRKLLPYLRLYSAWLLFSDPSFEEGETGVVNGFPVKQLWTDFNNCKAAISDKLDIVNIDDVHYLMEQDEDMLHFAPFAAAFRVAMSRSPDRVAKSARSDEAFTDTQS
jgi:hypothetical protein